MMGHSDLRWLPEQSPGFDIKRAKCLVVQKLSSAHCVEENTSVDYGRFLQVQHSLYMQGFNSCVPKRLTTTAGRLLVNDPVGPT